MPYHAVAHLYLLRFVRNHSSMIVIQLQAYGDGREGHAGAAR